MAFKATQYQIKNGDKNSSSGAGFKATKYKTYNPDVVRSWETTNKQSLDILNDYNNRINKSEWLDEEDRKKYRSALDTYIETSNNLRGINKMFGEGYTDEDEQKWTDSIASMNEAYDSTEKYYSQWIDEKDYNGQRDGWFQKSNLFDDGYQFGDVTKTIAGSVTDFVKNVGAGVIGIGESALDALVTLSPYFAQGQYYANGGGYNLHFDKMFDQQIEASKDWAEDFVKKDLYDENVVASAIIAEPVKALTGVDSETDSVFGKKTDSLTQSAGQLAGTIGLQAVGVPWWLTTGVTALGGESENALSQGATLNEAALSGLVSAGAEILTEKISNGISFGGKTLEDLLPKLTSKISNKVVKNLLDLGIDMVGEGGEEILSGVLSAVGQKLTYASEKEINELFSSEDALDSFIGGAVLGLGGSVIGNRIQANKQAREIYGNGAELVAEALDIDPNNALAKKMQTRVDKGKSLSGGQINRLVAANENAMVSQDRSKMKSAVESRLTELGEGGDSGNLADVIVKAQSGKKLTSSETNILVNSKYGRRVSTELNPKSIESGDYTSKWAENIGTERINTEAYNKGVSQPMSETNTLTTVRENVEAELTKLGEGENASAIAVAMVKKAAGAKLSEAESQLIENSEYASKVEQSYDIGGAVADAIKSTPASENATVKENATEGKFEASKASTPVAKATMVNNDGKEVEVKPQRFASTESGEMGVEIEGGKVVATSAVDFGDSGIGLVRQAAVDMSSRIGGFSVDTANVFVSGYDAASGQSAGAYIDGWVSAYKFGAMKNPPPLSALAANQKTAQLTEEQRKAAYNFGRAFGNEKIVNIVSNNAENISKTDSKKKNGRVIFDGERYGKRLNERQRASLKALNFIAEALGIDIYVDKLGKGDNGWYDPSDRSIHVNLEAGVEGEALMLYVASHELTHDIRATLPEKFNTLADAVFEEYNKRFGEHIMEDLIEAKIDFLKEKGDITEDMTEEEAYDLAFEEVICDCLETMLVDSNAMTALSKNIYAKDKSLWQRIKDFFARLVERIRAAYANADPDTEEGQRFRDLGEGAERIKRLWEEAIVELSEVDKTTGEGNVKHSYSSIAYSFFGDENISIKDMESGAYKKTEGYKQYVEQCLNNMRQSVEGFNEKAALKEIRDSIDGIVEVAVAMKKAGYDILDSEGGRNVRDSKKRLLFSSLEPNSDYFTSSDISTICDKRINFAEIYDEIVRREDAMGVPKNKRFFNNIDNYFVLHKILADKGLTAPCRQCYVESMRKNLDPMANAFIELMQEKNPDNKANKQLYQPSGKNKGELKSNNAKLRENLLEVIAREQYDITADDLTIKMLTTADGLAQLKLQAPLIYEAFNSFYGQSKPKMPKAATPFRFGELTALLTDDKGKIKTGLIKQIKSTGGFRLQSYSDFQIQNFADVLQVIFEAGTLGLNGHAYTKVPAFLDATKGTNLKRNISIFMYKDGGQWKIDRGDSFPYELEKIYDIVNADKSGNTSIIAVVQNEDMAAWIMANGNVGYFIPFHKSGVKMGVVRETIVREGGREIKGYSGIKDHTRQQTEVWATTNSEHKANTKVKKGINIYEFWDFDNADNLSQKELIKKNVMAYIDACNEAGYLPKFREYVMDNSKVLNKVLAYAKELGFVSENATVDDISFEYSGYRIPYGYYKCLVDFGMFTPDGKASPIERLSLKDYKFNEAVEFFSDAESLRRNEILQQFENGFEREKYRKSDMTTAELAEEVQNRRNQVVDEVVSGEYKKLKHSHKAAEKATYARDSQGNELSKEQQEFFKESKARDDEGNLLVLYHGTKAKERITEFLTTEGWRTGLWLTTDHNTGVTFAGGRDDTRLFTKENSSDGAGGRGVYELYANVKNPLIVDAQGKRYWEIPRPSVMGEGKPVSGEEVNAYAFENGYDGVIINDVVEGSNRLVTDVIVFYPNQVKYTDNLTPTERNDIRYSHKADKKATYSSNIETNEEFNIDDYTIEELLNFTDEDFQKAYESLGLEDIFSDEEIDDLALFGGDASIEDISETLNVEPKKIEILIRRKGLGESHIEANRTAVMTQKRIDESIEDSGAKFNPDYARKYITRISPKDFIDLTVSQNHIDRGQFDNEVEGDHGSKMSEYDYETALQNNRSPYLHIDRATGRVIGHNGRHRIRALEMAGVESVEIEVEFYDEDGYLIKYNANTIPDIAISSQFDTAIETHLSTVIPLNEAHRSEIEKTYGEKAHSDAGVKYQRQNSNDLKPRTLLVNALETAVSEKERNLLQTYKDNIDKLNAEQEKLEKVMEEADKIQYKRSLSISGEEMSVDTFKRRAKAKAEKNGINADDVQFKLDRSNSKYIAYAVGKGTILEADKTFRSAEDNAKLKELNAEAKEISAQINAYDRELLRLRAMQPIKDVLNREKAMAYKRASEKAEQIRKASVEKVRESAAKTEAKVKLQQLILKTSKWISYPGKDDVKCPDILRSPYAAFLNGIDLSSKRLLEGGEPTHNDERVANAMNNLANAIERITNAQNPSVDTDKVLDSGYLDLPVEFVAKLREMAENISKMMVGGDYVVNRMSATDVKQLTKLIRTLNHAIKEMSTLYANLRFANVEALGDNSMSFLESMGEAKGENAITDFVAWDNALPYYAFKRFGEGGESIFEGLMDGQDKLARLAKVIFDFKDKTWTDKESKEWGEDTHTITLPSGNTLTLTTADAMGIYCLSRREQGLQHLLGGGTRVLGIKKGTKKATDSRSTLTQEDINAIVASLTDRQKKVALDIQKFMSEVCSEWGNEVSMKRFLTKEFTDPNYYPIESNDENLSAKDPQAQQSDLYRLLNISATKPLAPGANNEVIIRNIFDVFIEHASDMAKLNAYGLALLDYMKWVNYREKSVNENGQINVRGVHKAMIRTYGDKAWRYVLNLIKDVNGRHNDNGDNTFLMNMMRMQKTASVGNNLRVAFLQFTSYPRAALVLSNKSLALGLTKKPQMEKAKKYCGIALWKSYGFYDTNIARSIEDQLKGTTDIRQKLIELTMKGPEYADAITWGALWNACEYEVAKTTKNKVGSEEYYQEVGLKLREVVYATQVVDSILTRSQIMRSKSGLTQTATAYMSEPTLTANILMDAGFQFQKEKRITGSAKTAWKNAGKYVVGAVGNYIILQLVTSIAESLADAWRDDDEEEFLEKFGEAFGENLVTNLIPFNKIPIISDIADLLLSFFGVGFVSSDNLSTSWLTQAANTVKAWSEVLGEEFGGDKTSKTLYNAIYQTAKAISSLTGVSVSGAMREVVAVWNNTAGAYDSSLKIRQYDLTETDKRAALYKAHLSGDEKESKNLEAEYEDQKDIDAALRKALRENDPRIKEAAEAYMNRDYNKYNSLREEIISEGYFTRQIVTDALKAEYKYLKDKAKEDK